MIMMARDRDYEQLRGELRGERVLIWTCNTCARLSGGIGGSESAEKLMDALRGDGIDVVGVCYTSASCIMGKVRAKGDPEMILGCDTVLSLTCDVGAFCAGEVFGKPVMNPIVTLGPGLIGEDGDLSVCTIRDGKMEKEELGLFAESRNLKVEPFV